MTSLGARNLPRVENRDLPRIVCITLTDRRYGKVSPHQDRARAHFTDRGVDAEYFYGINAAQLGLRTVNTYDHDRPGQEIAPMTVGCWLSHRALWAALLLLPDEEFLILEDDARFPEGWRERFDAARANLPTDWDVLFVGHCCAEDKRPSRVAGDVYECRYPMALHCYLVRRRALMTMMETQDAATLNAPIDISVVFHTWPKLRVYSVIPRIVDQFENELIP